MKFKIDSYVAKLAGAYLLPPVVKPKNPKKKYVRKPTEEEELEEMKKKAVANSLFDFQAKILSRFSDK